MQIPSVWLASLLYCGSVSHRNVPGTSDYVPSRTGGRDVVVSIDPAAQEIVL